MLNSSPLATLAGTPDPSSAAQTAVELGLAPYIDSQYYEYRLAAGQEQLDFLICFGHARAARLRSRLSERLDENRADPGWIAIQRLLECWADASSPLGMGIPFLWFEFDDIERAACGVCPSVSVCITRGYSANQPPGGNLPGELALCHQTLDTLGAGAAQRSRLDRAFSELPSGARWIHLSYMLGRAPHAIKLYGVMKRDELMGYLARVGWAGDRSAIAEALNALYPSELLGDDLYLDLNLENCAESKRCTLGLAVAQQHLLSGNAADPTRARILSDWTSAGLCDPRKVEQARSWPRTSKTVPVTRFEREFRFLDVKLVWQADTGFVAKAYLGRQRLRGLFS